MCYETKKKWEMGNWKKNWNLKKIIKKLINVRTRTNTSSKIDQQRQLKLNWKKKTLYINFTNSSRTPSCIFPDETRVQKMNWKILFIESQEKKCKRKMRKFQSDNFRQCVISSKRLKKREKWTTFSSRPIWTQSKKLFAPTFNVDQGSQQTEIRIWTQNVFETYEKKEGGSSASSLAASAPIETKLNKFIATKLSSSEGDTRTYSSLMDLQSTQFIGMKLLSSSGPIHPAPVESRQWEKRRRRKQLTCKHWNLMKMKSRRRKSQSQQIAATINSRTDTEQQYHGEEQTAFSSSQLERFVLIFTFFGLTSKEDKKRYTLTTCKFKVLEKSRRWWCAMSVSPKSLRGSRPGALSALVRRKNEHKTIR